MNPALSHLRLESQLSQLRHPEQTPVLSQVRHPERSSLDLPMRSLPSLLRHPERSAAKSKDPDALNLTHTARTFQPRNPVPQPQNRVPQLLEAKVGSQNLSIATNNFAMPLLLGTPSLQAWPSLATQKKGAFAHGVCSRISWQRDVR